MPRDDFLGQMMVAQYYESYWEEVAMVIAGSKLLLVGSVIRHSFDTGFGSD